MPTTSSSDTDLGPMLTAPAEEMSRHFARWADTARDTPVVVTRHKRPYAVLVSPEQFAVWRRHEAAGSVSEQRFEASLDMLLVHSSEGFFACDEGLKLMSANPVFETLVGKPQSQLWGRGVDELFGPNLGAILQEHFTSVLTTREAADVELRDLDRSLLVRAFPYPNGVAALVLNRSRELALRQRWARYQAVDVALSALPGHGRVELNLRGVFQAADAAFEDMVGFKLAELTSFRLAEVVQPKLRAAFNLAFETALNGGPPLISTVLLSKGGGALACDLAVATARRDGLPEAIMVVVAAKAPAGGEAAQGEVAAKAG